MHGIFGHQEGIRAFPRAENKPNWLLGRTLCLTPTNHSGEPAGGERGSARSGAWCQVGGRVSAGSGNDTAVSPGAWRYTQTGGQAHSGGCPGSLVCTGMAPGTETPPAPDPRGSKQLALRPSESRWPHRCLRTPGIFQQQRGPVFQYFKT